MKTQATWIMAAILCAGAVSQACAEGTNAVTGAGAGNGRRAAGGPMAELTFEKMDANGDGKVTQDEFQAAWADLLKKRFAALDANGDGVITKDEMEKARTQMKGRGGKRGGGEGAPAGGEKQK